MDPVVKPQDDTWVKISTQTGEGLSVLLEQVTQMVAARYGFENNKPTLTRQRHREALLQCLSALEAAGSEKILELSAENLRQAAAALGTAA